MQLEFTLNGMVRRLDVEPDETLLDVVRERLGLTGTKEGCDEGECGACTVLIDDRPVDSCIYPALAVEGLAVRTVEALSAPDGALSHLQRAFVDRAAVQCGFCTPGLLMTLTALLESNQNPSSSEVDDAIAGNICRCTGYSAIREAVRRAVEEVSA